MQNNKCKDCQHVSNHNRISNYNGAFCIRIYMKMNKSIFWLLYNFADNTYQNVTVNGNRSHPKFLQHLISLHQRSNSTDNASLDCASMDQIDTDSLPTQQNLFMNRNHKTRLPTKILTKFLSINQVALMLQFWKATMSVYCSMRCHIPWWSCCRS